MTVQWTTAIKDNVTDYFTFQQQQLNAIKDTQKSAVVSLLQLAFNRLTHKPDVLYRTICKDFDLQPYKSLQDIMATGSAVDPNWRKIANSAKENRFADTASLIEECITDAVAILPSVYRNGTIATMQKYRKPTQPS